MTGSPQKPLRVLVLGANGGLARNTTRVLLEQSDVSLTLYLRRAQRLANSDPSRVTIVEGDVLDRYVLRKAMKGQDVVYANLSGDMEPQALGIIEAMREAGVRRLIFISSMGIYSEVPGETYRGILDPYRDSAARIEATDLEYTILRPGWFDSNPAVDYQLTRKGEPFRGHDISLNSLSDLILKIVTTPGLHVRESLISATATESLPRTGRYPGVRSDSDLYTYGYRFKPWTGPPIATGAEIWPTWAK